MPIVYPLDFPSNVGLRGFKLRMNSVGDAAASPYTGEEQVQIYPGQWWEADVTPASLSMIKSGPWEAFLGKLNGRQGTFLMGDPARTRSMGSASELPGDLRLDGNHPAMATEIHIKTGLGETEGYMKAGDHLQIGVGSQTRLHMLLDDINLDANGKGDASIWPYLRESRPSDAAVIINNPRGRFRLLQGTSEFSRRPGIFTDTGFAVREALV